MEKLKLYEKLENDSYFCCYHCKSEFINYIRFCPVCNSEKSLELIEELPYNDKEIIINILKEKNI